MLWEIRHRRNIFRFFINQERIRLTTAYQRFLSFRFFFQTKNVRRFGLSQTSTVAHQFHSLWIRRNPHSWIFDAFCTCWKSFIDEILTVQSNGHESVKDWFNNDIVLIRSKRHWKTDRICVERQMRDFRFIFVLVLIQRVWSLLQFLKLTLRLDEDRISSETWREKPSWEEWTNFKSIHFSCSIEFDRIMHRIDLSDENKFEKRFPLSIVAILAVVQMISTFAIIATEIGHNLLHVKSTNLFVGFWTSVPFTILWISMFSVGEISF